MDEDPEMLKTCVFDDVEEEGEEGTKGTGGRPEDPVGEVLWRLLPCQAGHPHYALHTGESLQLGRSKDLPVPCHWPDVHFSGQHCTFALDAGLCLLVTDHSTNGVLVNGCRLGKGSSAPLKHGDIVTLARKQVKDGMERPAIAYQVQDPRAVLQAEGAGELGSDLNGTKAPTASDSPPASVDPQTAPEADAEQLPGDGSPAMGAAACAGDPGTVAITSDGAVSGPPEDPLLRKMEESLTCGVCQQVFHRPITCLPCMHNFCAGCFSQWQRRSTDCPQCRIAVTEVRRNHAIASVSEDYLALHPERKRSASELEVLDKKTTITDELLRLPKRSRTAIASAGGDSAEDTEESSEEESTHVRVRWGPAFGYGSATRLDRCRACDRPDRHGYQCPASGAAHHNCVLCHELFPVRPDFGVVVQCSRCAKHFCDRYWGCRSGAGMDSLRPLREHRIDVFPPGTFRGNQVELEVLVGHTRAKGWRAYDVWLKCLTFLPAWSIPRAALGWPQPTPPSAATTSSAGPPPSPNAPTVPSSPPPPPDADGSAAAESVSVPSTPPTHDPEAPLSTGVSGSAPTAPSACSPSLLPVAPAAPTGLVGDVLTPDPICCRRCTTEVFAELLFRYRLELPAEELPPSATARPPCWYGRDCRTQRHNRSHCERYNHACTPSR